MNSKVDKVLYVNKNLVVVYFVNRASLNITSDNGTALSLTFETLNCESEIYEDLEPTIPMFYLPKIAV
jgi:hypothetical protein